MTSKSFVAPGHCLGFRKGASSLVRGQRWPAEAGPGLGLVCPPFWSGIVLGKRKDFLRALTFQEEVKKQELSGGLQNSTVVKSLCAGLGQTWVQILSPLS